ncbi:MAG TPA: SGNH/GDSL hydrolase family protein, partial [Flavobacteriales bacterium]|nr:SGNH/GDSL hydrolase family protein [Flavobacteriales bacterium]
MVKLKKTLANLLLFMVALSIALFAGEGCVRLILPQDALLVRAYQRQHAELGYVAKSNFEYHDTKSMSLYNFEYTVRTNNMGLRMEAEVDPEKQSVLYLGDSFTFGWGVEIEESFFSLLTNSTTNSELQALNCGQGGYSTGHVSRRLELMTRQINVRKAIYFLNWNDVFDNANTDVNF